MNAPFSGLECMISIQSIPQKVSIFRNEHFDSLPEFETKFRQVSQTIKSYQECIKYEKSVARISKLLTCENLHMETRDFFGHSNLQKETPRPLCNSKNAMDFELFELSPNRQTPSVNSQNSTEDGNSNCPICCSVIL
eukprot:Sdes_comp21756_c0_seq1m20327